MRLGVYSTVIKLYRNLIALYIYQSPSTNSLKYSWKIFNCKTAFFFSFLKDNMISSKTNAFLARKLAFSCHNVNVQLIFL